MTDAAREPERDGAQSDAIDVSAADIVAAPPPDSADSADSAADDGGANGGVDGGGAPQLSDPDDAVVVAYEDRIIEALPELARLAALAWTRGAAWGVGTGLRVGARLARATVDPQTAAELAQDVGSNMRGYARELLGVTELEERVNALTPVGDRFAGPRAGELTQGGDPAVALRAQGAELLRQSADVSVDDRLHPAFGRILGELAPDEGRILRLLHQDGPQPVVDVRAANLIGVGSQLVAQNLNMVAMQAGCRHADRVPAYLINLQRLGLIAFSDEPLNDAITYQVLEAQPHVLTAIQGASRARTVQRSLRLTPFGTEFSEACFAPQPGPEPEQPELDAHAPAYDGDRLAGDQ